jgi:hypothetical protein
MHRPAPYPARQVCLKINDHMQQWKYFTGSLGQEQQLGALLMQQNAECNWSKGGFRYGLGKLHQRKSMMGLKRGFVLLDQLASTGGGNRHQGSFLTILHKYRAGHRYSQGISRVSGLEQRHTLQLWR